MSEDRSPGGRPPGLLPALFVAASLVAVTATLLWQQRTLARVADRLAALEERSRDTARAVQLYRFERGAEASLGTDALLEHLAFWAPQLGRSDTPQAALAKVRQQVEDILDAFEALGADAYPILEARFLGTEGGVETDELRTWLLRAALRADPQRGLGLVARTLEGFDFPVSHQLRLTAARLLIERDEERAAALLRRILDYESARGLQPRRVPAELTAGRDLPEGLMAPWPGYFNYVIRYLETEDPQAEQVLLTLLGREEHDTLTLQTVVKALGDLRSTQALPRLKELFENPPGTRNPIFLNHCLEAIAKIDGAGACGYLREALRDERDETVINKLRDLIKRYCS